MAEYVTERFEPGEVDSGVGRSPPVVGDGRVGAVFVSGDDVPIGVDVVGDLRGARGADHPSMTASRRRRWMMCSPKGSSIREKTVA